MPLIKYIKQPLSPSLAQFTDAELRKIESSISNLVESVTSIEDAAFEEGSFSGTATGFSSVNTPIITYRRLGRMVSLFIPSISGTSNATGFTITGLPAQLIPQAQQGHEFARILDNTVAAIGAVSVLATGIIQVYPTTSNLSTTWTASGTKTLIRKNLSYNI